MFGFFRKKPTVKQYTKSLAADANLMCVPFLFGAWLIDKEWLELFQKQRYFGDFNAALIFFGNDTAVRVPGSYADNRMITAADSCEVLNYELRDGGLLKLSSSSEKSAAENPFRPWYMTEDLGLMIFRDGYFDAYRPASSEDLLESGLSSDQLTQLIQIHRAQGKGFIETFTAEIAEIYIDARFIAESDNADKPAPPVT